MKRREFIKSFLISPAFLPNFIYQLDHNEKKFDTNKERILSIFSKYKKYAEIIEKYRTEYKEIFDAPLSMLFPHLYFESYFDNKAISGRMAVGIAQFKRYTALIFGIDVYDPLKYRDLHDLELKIELNFEELRMLEYGNGDINGFVKLLYLNEYENIKKLKDQWNKLKEENNKMVIDFKQKFFEYAKDDDFDKRTDVNISIDKSCFLIAQLASESREKYGYMKEFNILHAIASYNYGPRSWDYNGIPPVYETTNHLSKVIEHHIALKKIAD